MLLTLLLALPQVSTNPFLDKQLALAVHHLEAGDADKARREIERALERDDRHLGALRLLSQAALAMKDRDEAVYSLHRWLSIAEAIDKPNRALREERELVLTNLRSMDPQADRLRGLSATWVKGMLSLAKEHRKRGRQHSALETLQAVLAVDRLNEDARKAIRDIRRKGSSDVAVEDIFAGGGDPTEGLDSETVAELEAEHSTWETAFEGETTNYRYKTDAGYLVFKTAPIAMEQMNAAYRKFFKFKEDGDPTPKIGVYIYQSRDEYLEENGLPENDWTGGFFNGSTVQTFIGGQTGKESVRDMYGTLFHEAAHQFVSLTGKGGVPGWLNEAYASFFEGTTLLSNGSVRWNQVANHRLFPLAGRMEKGWMAQGRDASPDSEGNWTTPEGAPTFRIIVENDYTWGPPWYAPTWGVVYFLYNFRDENTGLPVYRDTLHDYYLSNAAGRGDPVEHFEKTVLLPAKDSPVQDIDALNDLWKDWILALRDIQNGKTKAGKSNLDFGDLATERGEEDQALAFYEEAFLHMSEDPEGVWKVAVSLEKAKELDRALSLYRQFRGELEIRGLAGGDERYEVAGVKVEKLDPLYRRQVQLRESLREDGLALVRSYRDQALPTMALETARRLSSQFSLPEALDLYTNVARASGKSLARWRIAYNELDLEGWSGGENFRAYGNQIEAAIEADPTIETQGGSFQTQELACDLAFEADFSLEAQMQFGLDSNLLGLCLGRKDTQNMHAVLLHPTGYLDISTKQGGVWTIRDHRAIPLDAGWHKLRIDVIGKELDVWLDGAYIRTMEMPSLQSMRGTFGLIAGLGKGAFREIRILTRDPRDPASRIEHELAMEKVANAEIPRAPGSFSGIRPPALQMQSWLQGEPTTLSELIGRPAVLAFWSINQDRIQPTFAYYAQLVQKWSALEIPMVVVASAEDSPAAIQAWLKDHPMPGVRFGVATFSAFEDYNLGAAGFGLPRVLILDVDGRVTYEGDLGLKNGRGWKEGDDDTFLDGALDTVVEQRHLQELKEQVNALVKGQLLHESGRHREAMKALAPLANLEANWAQEVQAARNLSDRIEALGADLPRRSAIALETGFPLTAAKLLEQGVFIFPGTATGELCRAQLAKLEKNRLMRDTKKSWRALQKAHDQAERGRDAAAILSYLDQAAKSATTAQATEACESMRIALLDQGPAAILSIWKALQPKANLTEED